MEAVERSSDGSRTLVPRALAMAAVLLLAVVLRTTFVTGVIHNDNLAYISTAHDFAQHKAHDATNATPRLREGVGRLTTYLPVGLLYRIFGVSDRVTLAWPFLCSLLTVILTYRVTVLLAGESAGLIAALVWAIRPLDVSLATTLLPEIGRAHV